jgi:hypothetical protein
VPDDFLVVLAGSFPISFSQFYPPMPFVHPTVLGFLFAVTDVQPFCVIR